VPQTVVYCGPFDQVDLPTLSLRAKPGEEIEVSDEAAESLLAQLDNWAEAGSPSAKAAAARVADAAKRIEADQRAAAKAARAAAGNAAPTPTTDAAGAAAPATSQEG
jgi:hypothetical protein